MGRKTQVKCKGDEARFEEVARFVYERFGNSVHYIADVAGGQGMLSRILNKKYNYPDEAVREVVESAKVRPVLVVPCCNFWDRTRKLGTKEMVADICKWLEENGIRYETVTFSFKGPKNIGILTYR